MTITITEELPEVGEGYPTTVYPAQTTHATFGYLAVEVAEGGGLPPGETTPPTGVTGGSPGAFEPPEAIPADLAALKADPVVGDAGTSKPGAAWAEGEHVVLGDGSSAYWDGTAWVAGEAPALIVATSANAGTPGTWNPVGAAPPANLAAMGTVTAGPTTAWITGQHMVLGNASHCYWSGASWMGPGEAP